jgi:outer membrane protein OmpA-like peptidoglycan-associated protein
MKLKYFLFCLLLGLNHIGRAQENLQFLSKETLFYAPTSAIISPTEANKLNTLISAVGEKKIGKFIIQSHTDSVGDMKENQILSEKRSKAVLNYLLSKGIAKELIYTENNGEVKPLSDNGSDEGRRNNRCTVVELYELKEVELMIPNSIKISGTLKDGETNLPIADSMVLVFHKENPDTVYTDKKGYFEVNVPDSAKAVDFFVKDYFFSTVELSKDKNNVKLDLPLTKAKIGNKANFDNINFYGGSPMMISGSYKICDKIVRFLKYNPERVVEIGGHVNVPNSDKVSQNSDDYMLSMKRANRVCIYLAEKGIKAERMVAKGYGNWHMLYPINPTGEQQVKNRRVEVRIIK